ncbi:MAG: hypothetical protein QOF89_5495 [Acidobacteriota bacterium]|jgi:hypothetical protein|nr:hypothetical protein [Acidobacteriota bacterium]
MSSQIRAIVLVLAGLLLSASAGLHGFVAWPHLHGDLIRDHASPGLIGALSLGWHFGSLAMLAFSLISLSAGVAVWQGRSVSAGPLWIVAAACIAFGLGAFFLYGHSVHLLGFALMGALVAIGAVSRGAPSPGSPRP